MFFCSKPSKSVQFRIFFQNWINNFIDCLEVGDGEAEEAAAEEGGEATAAAAAAEEDENLD